MIVAVLNEQHEIALIRQNWLTTRELLVARYIKPGETAEDCVLREVFEETGLKPYRAEYLSSHHHDRRDCLMLAHIARVMKAEFGSHRKSTPSPGSTWTKPSELEARSIAEKVYVEAEEEVLLRPLDPNDGGETMIEPPRVTSWRNRSRRRSQASGFPVLSPTRIPTASPGFPGDPADMQLTIGKTVTGAHI